MNYENEELKVHYRKIKDETLDIDSGNLSSMQHSNQDTSKRFKRNARSLSFSSSVKMKNSNNNIN